MTDLVQRLTSAAAEAIANQAPAIVDGAGNLRSITLELQIANGGQVIDSVCYVERRGVHRIKKEVAA